MFFVLLLTVALPMAGKPFHSILEPFYEEIVRGRKAGMTWQEIATKLGDEELYQDKAVKCTRQAVQYYFNRRRRKNIRVPQGMEPVPTIQPSTPPNSPPSHATPETDVDAKKEAHETGHTYAKWEEAERKKDKNQSFKPYEPNE